jgi:Cu(I)/Ag(I) efflux system membrane fusion protein
MKGKTLLVGALSAALLGLAGWGLYAAGMKRGAETPVPTAGRGSVAAERKPLYWHDPMVPGARFDKPGKSPFMDMQLVPVYAEPAAGADAGVSISPRLQQNLGVRTAEVVQGSLTPQIEATGSVGWNERAVAVVPARANGFVEKLHARAPFEVVAQGQPLAELYVPDWVAAQEEFLALRRMQGTDLQPLVDGARQRMRLAGMNDAQIARVEAAGRVQARTTVSAPIAGVLAELNVREGAAVASGAPMFRINALSPVWVLAEVPEALAGQVRRGDPVEAMLAGGISRSGKVEAVLPDIHPSTRTYKVRIELPNADRQLLPGMFATLRFRPAARPPALLIPAEALIATGQRNLVMLAQDNGAFMPVEVERGIEADGRIEIRKGLQAGQRVVLSGQFLVDSEASLKGLQARQPASGEKQ